MIPEKAERIQRKWRDLPSKGRGVLTVISQGLGLVQRGAARGGWV